MRIGLVDVDSKIPNVALMKLAAWHTANGDVAGMYEPLFDDPDLIYASKMFEYTDDYAYFPSCEVLMGGPGYSNDVRLPDALDAIMPDYGLYAGSALWGEQPPYSIGRVTRGCFRRCPWCVVPEIDGAEVRQVAEVRDFLAHDHVRMLDDQILALPDLFTETCKEIAAAGASAVFDALDARLMTSQTARALKCVTHGVTTLNMSFDRPSHEGAVRQAVAHMTAEGICSTHIRFFVLVGFNTTREEDLARLAIIREINVRPFVMPYNKKDIYQARLARWANIPQAFMSVSFGEYEKLCAEGRVTPRGGSSGRAKSEALRESHLGRIDPNS